MNPFLAVPLIVGSVAYLLYTSWQMQHERVGALMGYGQILISMGGLTWGLVAWYPYIHGFTGNLGLFGGTFMLAGAILTIYGRSRERAQRR